MKDVNILIENGVDVNGSLEVLGDMETYDETVIDFLNEIDSKLNNLKESKGNNDLANFAIYAHSIKSDARYLGFTKLAEVAYEEELAGKENNLSRADASYEEMLNQVNLMVSTLKRYIGNTTIQDVKEEVTLNPNSKTILVVDDSDIIRNFISKIFNNTYNVVVAHDGREAIDILNTTTFDSLACILLDLNMPNVNGFEVLDYLDVNNLYNIIPVSIITGDDSKDTVERAFTYPIVDVLQKPFNENNVKDIVDKMVSLKR